MFIKKIIRSTQGFIERFILGGLVQDIIWKYKHLYQKIGLKHQLIVLI